MFAKPSVPKRSFASAMNSDGYTLHEQYNWAVNAQILAKYTKTMAPTSTGGLAYLGAFSDYYIKNTDFEAQDDIDEIYVLDSDPKLLQQYHSDMSDVLKNKEKWFLHYDSSNFILEPNSTDMVVINDRVCCKYTPNIPRTILQVVNTLKEGGILLGVTSCKDSFNDIQSALHEYDVETEVYEDSKDQKLRNNVYLYSMKKNNTYCSIYTRGVDWFNLSIECM